jgi:hypothetical protein
VKGSAWANGLEVTGGGTGVVSHAGLGLVTAEAGQFTRQRVAPKAG